MAKILLAWELGGGLGHVTVLRPVAQALRRRGHQVLVAARDLCAAEKVFRGSGIPVIQAPFKQGPAVRPFIPQRSYAHLLHHAGFESKDELSALVGAWSALFDLIRPDVTLFDHSPTALLASRGRRMRRALIGTGFCAPPAGDALPDMRPWLPPQRQRLVDDEARTLATANSVLQDIGRPSLDRLSDIYGQADENLLTSYPELDHFGSRDGVRYWGTFQACPGIKPVWPKGTGKRIYAYLKRTKTVADSIRALGECGHPTIIFAPGLGDGIRSRFAFPNLHVSSEPLEMHALASESDLAVLNGTHGATAEFLMAGKPILQLPIYLEQRLVAQRTVDLGAGLTANRTRFGEICRQLDALLQDSQFRKNAESFAARYAARNRQKDFQEMVASVNALAG